MQPHNEIRLPADLRSRWLQILAASGISVEVDATPRYRGSKTRVEWRSLTVTAGDTRASTWELVELISAPAPYLSLIYINSVVDAEEALNEAMFAALAPHGASKHIYGYPERA